MPKGYIDISAASRTRRGYIDVSNPDVTVIEPDEPVAAATPPQTQAPAKGGWGSDLKRGVGTTISLTGSALRDIAPDAGEALQEYGDKIVEANPAEINSLRDVVDKPVTTAREAVGESAAPVGVSAAGAATGAAIGSLAGPGGTFVGAGIGAFAPSWVQEYGEIRENQRETGKENKLGAAVGATIAAGLDLLGPEVKLGKRVGERALGKVAETTADGVIKRTAKEAATEAATEAGQTIVERGFGGKDVASGEALNEVGLSAVKGGIGGGVASNIMPGKRPTPQQTPEEIERPIVAGGEEADALQAKPVYTTREGSDQLEMFSDLPEGRTTDVKSLLPGIRAVETGKRPNQTSEAGAIGAHQLLPSTARRMASKLGIEFDRNRLLNDVEYNGQLAEAYLTELLQRYDGDALLAVTAYHAGEGNVDSWLKRFGNPHKVGMDAWLNKIASVGNPRSAAYPRKVLAALRQTSFGQDSVDLNRFENPDAVGGLYDQQADEELIAAPFSQSSLVSQFRAATADREGKPGPATAEVAKLSAQLSKQLEDADIEGAQRTVQEYQEKLDRALLALDKQQRELDAAGDNNSEAQSKFQSELDAKLDKLTQRQNIVAAAGEMIKARQQEFEYQPSLDLQQPSIPTADEDVNPTPAQTPAAPVATPMVQPAAVTNPQPVQDANPAPAMRAADTQLAQNMANEAAEESIKAGPQRQRMEILKSVLADPETRRPTGRFLAEVRSRGMDGTLTPEEAQMIADHEQLREDTNLGVPEARPAEPQAQRTIEKPRPAKAPYTPPFQLRQQSQEDLDRLNAADAKRERKAARPAPQVRDENQPDLFDERPKIERRAKVQGEKLGSTKREWFQKGVQAAMGEDIEPPAGKTMRKWFDQGKAFVEAEREIAAEERGETTETTETTDATPAQEPETTVTPADREAFDTRLDYMLESKSITPKMYQQIKTLADQGNTPITQLDEMLDNAAEEHRARRFGPKSRIDDVREGEVLPSMGVVWSTLRRELNRLGLADVDLHVIERDFLADMGQEGSAGVFYPPEAMRAGRSAIFVALEMSAGKQKLTLHHEAIHALRNANLFEKAEWAAVSRWAANRPGMKAWFEANYPADSRPELMQEEMVAEAFARWMRGKEQPTGLAQRAIRKIYDLLASIGRALNVHGFYDAEQVFEAINRGEVGRRPRAPGPRRTMAGALARKDGGNKNPMPEPMRDAVENLGVNLQDAAKNGSLWLAFTEDVANMAAKVLPSAKKIIELQSRSHALARRFEERLVEIKREYEALPARLKGNGNGTINKFLYESRMKSAWGFQPTYLKTVKIDPEMAAKFKALGPDGQAVVRKVYQFNYEARRQMLTATIDAVNAEYDPQIAAAGDEATKAELRKLKDQALKYFSRLHAAPEDLPYSPLKRDGNFVVIGMSSEYAEAKENLDGATMAKLRSDPNHYWVDFRDTKAEAAKLAARLRDGGHYAVTQDFQRDQISDRDIGGQELYVAFNQLRQKIADQLIKEPSEAGRKFYQLATDLYLHTLSDTAARKSELKADLIAAEDPTTGEAIDMMQAFVSRGQATTHFVANLSNSSDMYAALEQMRREAASTAPGRDERERFRQELLWRYVTDLNHKPSRTVDKLTRGVSLWNLLLSPAYHLQNATQVMMFSQPAIAAKVGYAKATSAITRAYADIVPAMTEAGVDRPMDLNKLPNDVKGVVQFLMERGRLDAGLANELGDWQVTGNGAVREVWRKVDRVLRYLPQNVETMNRVVTGIAAYRSARSAGMNEEAAREFASKTIYDTHGDYSGFNTPRVIAQFGNAGKVMFQFRKFQLITASLYAKMLHNSFKGSTPEEKAVARKALAFTLAHTTAAAGLVGFPAASLMGSAVELMIGMFGDDEDKKKYKDWEADMGVKLKEALGDGVLSDMLYRGAPYAMMGVDMSERLGSSQMLSIAPYSDLGQAAESRDKAQQTIGAILGGPLGGLPLKGVDAYNFFRDGDYYRALEAIAPNGLSGVAKAARLNNRGMQANNGDTILQPDEIDGMTKFWTALGLTSSQMSDLNKARSYNYLEAAHYKDQTTHIKRRYANAAKAGDTEKLSELRKEWAALQEARVSQGLKKQPLSTLLSASADQRKREVKKRKELVDVLDDE